LVLVLGSLLPVTDVLKKNGILVLPLRENFGKTKSPLANQRAGRLIIDGLSEDGGRVHYFQKKTDEYRCYVYAISLF